jgi:hypothetical protein
VRVAELVGDDGGGVVGVEGGADVVALREADDELDALELGVEVGVGVDSFCPPVISCLVAIGRIGWPAR